MVSPNPYNVYSKAHAALEAEERPKRGRRPVIRTGKRGRPAPVKPRTDLKKRASRIESLYEKASMRANLSSDGSGLAAEDAPPRPKRPRQSRASSLVSEARSTRSRAARAASSSSIDIPQSEDVQTVSGSEEGSSAL
ncbi:hypothetical protein OH77DRAFT_1430651 [Trametes cingulata]|nr:hypothetical protein OH77DRAFT_1430651 [Trametes cingulata]